LLKYLGEAFLSWQTKRGDPSCLVLFSANWVTVLEVMPVTTSIYHLESSSKIKFSGRRITSLRQIPPAKIRQGTIFFVVKTCTIECLLAEFKYNEKERCKILSK